MIKELLEGKSARQVITEQDDQNEVPKNEVQLAVDTIRKSLLVTRRKRNLVGTIGVKAVQIIPILQGDTKLMWVAPVTTKTFRSNETAVKEVAQDLASKLKGKTGFKYLVLLWKERPGTAVAGGIGDFSFLLFPESLPVINKAQLLKLKDVQSKVNTKWYEEYTFFRI